MFAPQLAKRRGRNRERQVRLLAAVLDVRMWQQLRREEGLDREETGEHLVSLVEALLAS